MVNPTPKSHRAGTRRLLATAGVLLFAGVGITAATFTDTATLNLGGGGIGNPTLFDIAVRDGAGQLQDAELEADAVLLPLTDGEALNETDPVAFEARFENRDPGITGDLVIQVFDPDPQPGDDLFDQLLFTIYLQGASVPAIAGATAAEVNAAQLTEADVQPGGTVDVRLEAVIAPGAGIAVAGTATQLGLKAEGESR
ncbi:hypothetical protein [Leucobacter komagatae]|uniref:Uncharacterized protein n=1 Tax=Leucobacter komagatae TaxID=55969 RepID=A0A0D0IPJ1_9MICO|nr:hypothetical protein [Leucobacter komagatae]KIP51443.1 hypothetical protein SD72_15305 [Leucobacter komagatae]